VRYWKGLKANNEPLFPQNDLLRGEHEQKLSKSEKRERVEVLLELKRFDGENKSLKERVRTLKLRRKLLLERSRAYASPTKGKHRAVKA
jgi:hypothetical protein